MNTETELSVIICTHNPRKDYLRRVVEALKAQSLSCDKWELLVIDNCSTEAIDLAIDLSWHPRGSVIPEKRLGQTWARICGIKNSKSNLILFVDDDNVLASGYLENALAISKTHPFLGAFGGCINLEFEIKPPPWIRDFKAMLAYKDVDTIKWSNVPGTNCAPCGAASVYLRLVAEQWAQDFLAADYKDYIGRQGGQLSSADDTMLVMTALKCGYGMGLFPALRCEHLIESRRLQSRYLVRLAEGISFSNEVLRLEGLLPPKKYQLLISLLRVFVSVRKGLIYPFMNFATVKGIIRARRILRLKNDSSDKS